MSDIPEYGAHDGPIETCPYCKGTSEYLEEANIWTEDPPVITPCPACCYGRSGEWLGRKHPGF